MAILPPSCYFGGLTILESHLVPASLDKARFSDCCRELFQSIPSNKGIKKAIKRGALLLDGNRTSTGTWVQPGQRIDLVRIEETPPAVFPMDLPVHFEDDFIAVVYKPAGLVTSGNQYKTLENALAFNLLPSAAADALAWARPVHRLDRATSGLVLIAKSWAARVALGQALEQKAIHKRYRTVVMGLMPESGSVETPIEEKAALSEFERVRTVRSGRNGHLSLVNLFPRTGRTHQLRIHMAGLGNPILGDPLYGPEGAILRGKGMFLSAVELRFAHPVTGKPMAVQVEQPAKFDHFMEGEERRWLKHNPTK